VAAPEMDGRKVNQSAAGALIKNEEMKK
jgi:hypothetical protein